MHIKSAIVVVHRFIRTISPKNIPYNYTDIIGLYNTLSIVLALLTTIMISLAEPSNAQNSHLRISKYSC